MTEPVIITVAITGAIPHKADSPAVPVRPAEQIEAIHGPRPATTAEAYRILSLHAA